MLLGSASARRLQKIVLQRFMIYNLQRILIMALKDEGRDAQVIEHECELRSAYKF